MNTTGYIIKWNEAKEVDSFNEQFVKGSFTGAIAKNETKALDRCNGDIVAEMANGTLKLIEDDIGLRFEITSDSCIRYNSHDFGYTFVFLSDKWSDTAPPTRTVTSVQSLYDVFPKKAKVGIAGAFSDYEKLKKNFEAIGVDFKEIDVKETYNECPTKVEYDGAVKFDQLLRLDNGVGYFDFSCEYYFLGGKYQGHGVWEQ